MGSTRKSSPVNKALIWVKRQPTKVKIVLAAALFMFTLMLLRFTLKDHNYFFLISEVIHAGGILVLIYKLTLTTTCSGLSLKTQELTAIFLGVRVFCSIFMEGDIHTYLDLLSLGATSWVIYMIKYKLKSTYSEKLDTTPILHLVVPCFILALLIHPHTNHSIIIRVLWAFCVYLEAVSVYPQLRMIQNAKLIEPFTAHYVFALGVARFLGCAYWIMQVYDTAGAYMFMIGSGYFWVLMIFISEIVQTFILADFCYYYVKSVMSGQLIVSLV